MLVVGLQSGKGSIVENKWIKHITSVYHFLTCCVMLANIVVELSVRVPAQGVFTNQNVMQIVAFISSTAYILQITCCSWISFYKCHRDSGFLEYYRELEKLIESNNDMEKKLKSLKFRVMSVGVVLIGWLLAMIPAVLYIVRVVDYANVNPEILKIFQQPSEILAGITYFISLLHWSMQTAYIATISLTLWQIGEAFNNNFINDCESPVSIQNLINYRVMHLSWCRLVSTANKCLRWMVAATLTGSIVVSLITLYIIAKSDFSTNQGTAVLIHTIFYFFALFGSMAIIIVLAEQVAATVSLQITNNVCIEIMIAFTSIR